MNSKYLHKTLIASGLLLVLNVSAEEVKIYQQDSTGNIQYHKPSVVIQNDGRIVETDSVGNMLYTQTAVSDQRQQGVPNRLSREYQIPQNYKIHQVVDKCLRGLAIQ